MEHTKNETIIHDTDKESSWEQQTAMKVSGISILVNLLLSIFKLIAGIAAHSGAMISDAIILHPMWEVLLLLSSVSVFLQKIGQGASVRT